ncbi:uncharacterized [Tachysurus ichikawai]
MCIRSFPRFASVSTSLHLFVSVKGPQQSLEVSLKGQTATGVTRKVPSGWWVSVLAWNIRLFPPAETNIGRGGDKVPADARMLLSAAL